MRESHEGDARGVCPSPVYEGGDAQALWKFVTGTGVMVQDGGGASWHIPQRSEAMDYTYT